MRNILLHTLDGIKKKLAKMLFGTATDEIEDR